MVPYSSLRYLPVDYSVYRGRYRGLKLSSGYATTINTSYCDLSSYCTKERCTKKSCSSDVTSFSSVLDYNNLNSNVGGHLSNCTLHVLGIRPSIHTTICPREDESGDSPICVQKLDNLCRRLLLLTESYLLFKTYYRRVKVKVFGTMTK